MNKEKTIKELSNKYNNYLNKDFSLAEIIKELNIQEEFKNEDSFNIISQSSKKLTNKWNTGRKTLRTKIAYDLIPNYPLEILDISLMIDAKINLLDDLLDEVMNKDEKAYYIIELIKLEAKINQIEISLEIKKSISKYFSKILSIAITEEIYKEKIKNSNNFDDRLSFAVDCYNFKSLDMDIYFELPLMKNNFNRKQIDEIIFFTRISRALSLVYKDFLDLEHDQKNKTETPLLILYTEEKQKIYVYLKKIIARYKEKSSKKIISSNNKDLKFMVNNIKKKIVNDSLKLEKIIKDKNQYL